MKASKIFAVVISLITVINLAGMIILFCKVNANTDTDKTNPEEFIMFVGLNDKDTCEQEISDDAATLIVRSVFDEYVDGYTLMNAEGAWSDDSGFEVNESTIICYVTDVDESVIHNIADELIEELNQEAILIKRSSASSEFYEG